MQRTHLLLFGIVILDPCTIEIARAFPKRRGINDVTDNPFRRRRVILENVPDAATEHVKLEPAACVETTAPIVAVTVQVEPMSSTTN